jgi:hypothetical protein
MALLLIIYSIYLFMESIKKSADFSATTKARANALAVGVLLLNSVRKVANGKFQLEFISKIQKPINRPKNILALANVGDSAFDRDNTVIKKYAYVTANAAGLKALFNIDATTIGDDVKDLNRVINNGMSIQITEIDENTMSAETKAKLVNSSDWLKDQSGQQVYSSTGGRIFRRGEVVQGAAKHLFIQGKTLAPVAALLHESTAVEAGDMA